MGTRYPRLPQSLQDVIFSNNQAEVVGIFGLPIQEVDVNTSGAIYLDPSHERWSIQEPYGDIRGPFPAAYVWGITGIPFDVNAEPPLHGQVPAYSDTNGSLSWVDTNGLLGIAGGDVAGPYTNMTVVGIQTVDVNPATPVNGQVLTFTSADGKWGPRDAGSGGPPSPHKTTHENGGSDEINVAGLSGVLADPQTPTAHATSHEPDGSDEILATVIKKPCVVATTAALPANTYNNGASGVGATLTANANGAIPSQDGQGMNTGDRILVWFEATSQNNGIYTITQLGSAGTPWILTRATDANTPAKFLGDIPGDAFSGGFLVPIIGGTLYRRSVFIMRLVGNYMTIGTDAITFWRVSVPVGTSAQIVQFDASGNTIVNTVSGDATISNAGVVTLANTAVTPASYGSDTASPTYTVDSKGRLTAAANVTITPAESNVTFTDITTNNSSTTKHGYLKKLDNTATNYMDGTGNWSVPESSLPSSVTFLNATSSQKTPASDQDWLQMTGNSIALTSGTWILKGSVYVGYGTIDTQLKIADYMFSTTNGADNATPPTVLATGGNITLKAGLANPGTVGTNTWVIRFDASGAEVDSLYWACSDLLVAVSATTTVYLVPYLDFTGTATNGRATVNMWALKVSTATS